ncbi:DUF1613-domain-containing protein [Patellaria atrata CBS 101060]|uniref:tRNA (uracil-O(2)-)-methyltransferase n=1 Tax=Patellaria atrata CBS 101060 TaxID=1346257 RepID=A0A9P4SC55_9PEZI|nr:DUF1613-domain-containing protein [Patellaria atrata CBS 101060]
MVSNSSFAMSPDISSAHPSVLDLAQEKGKKGFIPQDLTQQAPIFALPDEIWLSIVATPCNFVPQYFLDVMDNLIKHPEISSTHLARAEIFWDSEKDASLLENELEEQSISSDRIRERILPWSNSKFVKYMSEELKPIAICVPGYQWERTITRRMVPRNQQLDKSLVQTCHFFRSAERQHHKTGVNAQSQCEGGYAQRDIGFHAERITKENYLVVYIPHTETPDQIPWYHPAVRALAFMYTWYPPSLNSSLGQSSRSPGTLSIHYSMFSDTTLDTRLARTALTLLRIIHRHGIGRADGYVKRVHHDLVIPQARFQDTYARLKVKYAKRLIGEWVEQTDPAKHVFEDLGIAAFLIELWKDMYGSAEKNKNFPGFVDIGCGNGVLVNVLLQEGYEGSGFDARSRKSWSVFPEYVRKHIKQMILIPKILQDAGKVHAITETSSLNLRRNGDGELADVFSQYSAEPATGKATFNTHNGTFPSGTFIISNHADELTPWTPILAHLSDSPFIAIPCCSHDFSGARSRAPTFSSNTSSMSSSMLSASDASESNLAKGDLKTLRSKFTSGEVSEDSKMKSKPNSQPSAYSSLVSWVSHLTSSLGFIPESEMLRIPSTRNAAVLGRCRAPRFETGARDYETRRRDVEALLECEIKRRSIGLNLEELSTQWIEKAEKLRAKKGEH